MTLRGMARLSSVLRRRSRRGLSKALAGILLVALLGSSLVEDLEVRALPMEDGGGGDDNRGGGGG